MPSLGRDLLGDGESLAVEAYRQRLLSAFAIGSGKGKRALDLGCGDGLEAVYLARLGYQVEALDLEAHPRWEGIQKTWKGRVRFKLVDVADLEKLKPGYDLVFEKDLLHHVQEPAAALAEMKRLVKKGGRILLAECNRYNPIFYLHLTLLGNHQHFSRGRLKSLLAQAGLQGYRMRLREARVWPMESPFVQKVMDLVQEIIERMQIFNPWLCYHLVSWQKS